MMMGRTMNNRPALEINILIGLDDMAHNRLHEVDMDTGKSTPVSNYGKRNRKLRCYCKELKKLGVKA
jgi:hypothetical protein